MVLTKFSQHHLLYSLYFTKDNLVDDYEIHDSREHSGEEVAEDKMLREKALKEDNQKEPDTEDAKVGDVICMKGYAGAAASGFSDLLCVSCVSCVLCGCGVKNFPVAAIAAAFAVSFLLMLSVLPSEIH